MIFHIWHSIDLTQKSLKIILEELLKLQPEKKVLYSKCTQDSSAKIEALRKKLKGNLASIPKDKRVIAIPHNSLNYLGEEFDIQNQYPFPKVLILTLLTLMNLLRSLTQ